MNLPEKYELQMKKLLGDEYRSYLDSFSRPAVRALRVNEAKISVDGFIRLRKKYGLADPEPVKWTHNGFYVPDGETPQASPLYYAGLCYLQDPAAMAPAELLPVSAGDRVLDLCAAPGGKATELAAKLRAADRNSPDTAAGFLCANDISSGRASALKKNIERFGLTNTCVTVEDPRHLAECFPAYFDKILVDAPCSGEGMFGTQPEMVRAWEERGPGYYTKIQRGILLAAAKMLAPGGMLLYSTCTYSPEEDEEQVDWLVSARTDFTCLALPEKEGFSHRETEDGTGAKCVRLYPHRTRCGGQFCALLKKQGTREKRAEPKAGGWHEYIKNGEVYVLPAALAPVPGVRYALTGLHKGTEKRGRLKLSQGFAMAADTARWPDVIDLRADDPRAVRYLKGETIEIPENRERKSAEKQETLVTVDGFPLGFGRRNKNLLKNGLNPGWRML